MKVRNIFVLLLSLVTFFGFGQVANYQLTLAGFALGQWKNIPSQVLGKPYMADTTLLGVNFEAFKHPAGKDMVLVAEYTSGTNSVISSLHLSSWESNQHTGFLGLEFGMNQEQVKKILGKPSDILSIGEYGSRWDYENANFFLEIDLKGKLWGIKVFDKPGNAINTGNLPLPSFYGFIQALKESNNRVFWEQVAPQLVVKNGKKEYRFNNAWNLETEFDQSGLLKLLTQVQCKLAASDTLNRKVCVQSLLPKVNQPPAIQVVFKNNCGFNELIYEAVGDKYRLVSVSF